MRRRPRWLRFGVSEAKLIETVKRVGPMAEDVRRSLGAS